MDKPSYEQHKDPNAPFTYHVIPRNDWVEHEFEDCVCGPDARPKPRPDGAMGFVVVHHSLDGREYEEKGTTPPPDRGDQASG